MAETDGFGLARIGQVMVGVRDLSRAVEFYRDRLGMRFLFEVPQMAFFDCGGTRLMLGVPEAGAGAGSSILYYDVADIAGAHRALSARGVEFVEAPRKVADLGTRELWLAFFRDSEDNTLALMSEVEKDGG